jgi:hypothetical protein
LSFALDWDMDIKIYENNIKKGYFLNGVCKSTGYDIFPGFARLFGFF